MSASLWTSTTSVGVHLWIAMSTACSLGHRASPSTVRGATKLWPYPRLPQSTCSPSRTLTRPLPVVRGALNLTPLRAGKRGQALAKGGEIMWPFGRPNVAKLRKDSNVKGLVRALRHKDWDVRQEAVWALGKIADPRAVEPLIAALGDENWAVHRAAAEALGKMADRRAVEPPVAALKDQDSVVQAAAREALQRIGGPEGGRALAEYRSGGK
jgi:hypothetical protein